MINSIEKTKIYFDNFEFTLLEKQAMQSEIETAIKYYNCSVFDYSEGYLQPAGNIYAIPKQLLNNSYIIENKHSLELLNQYNGIAYTQDNLVSMNRYLFDFDFDKEVNIEFATEQLKQTLIDYCIPARIVFTGNRGVHLVILSNNASSTEQYKTIWYELHKILKSILDNEINGYLDIQTNKPNLYTRIPNAIRPSTKAQQTVYYEKMEKYEIVVLDNKPQNTNKFIPTIIKSKNYKEFSFDLDSFYRNTKNNNVRLFIDCNAKEGNRTETATSAIGTLRKAKATEHLIQDLTDNFCKTTGCEKTHLTSILYNYK